MIEIPLVASKANYRIGVPIGNVADSPLPVYLLDVRWNSRAAAWYMDISEIDETPIVCGVRLSLGAYLARQTSHKLFSKGVFVMIDTTRQGQEAQFDDVGKRVVMRYFSDIEVAVGIMRRLAKIGAAP